jgi:glycosyltransferase involved in cell wall biosynthesis
MNSNEHQPFRVLIAGGGVAALEAALAGSAVVITPYGCTREYFGDRVVYARPGDDRAVALALTRAWQDGPDPRLAGHVAANFTWSVVAAATREAYDRVAV